MRASEVKDWVTAGCNNHHWVRLSQIYVQNAKVGVHKVADERAFLKVINV